MAIRLSTWLWRGLIALVFLMAAWSKWDRGIEDLRPRSVYDRIVAGSPTRHYAILAAEVLVGVWLLSGLKLRWSAIYTATMLTAFIILLGFEIRSANPQLCDCGLREVFPGGDPRVNLAIGIVRNFILLLGCGWIWLFADEPDKPTLQPPAPGA
jgi:uncharacterized membrane protein YphA (DoxX/SURF4 family)